MKKEEKENNVAFVGESPWKPLVEVQTSESSIKLPEDQSKPFYHAEAALLIRTFPHLYKPVKAKGDK